MLLFCVAILLALGLVVLYSSSMTQVGAGYLAKQALWVLAGVLAFAVAANVKYETLKELSPWLLVFACVLLAMVYVPHVGIVAGPEGGKARRWIGYRSQAEQGGVRFQPSELAKVALILALAFYCDRRRKQIPTLLWGIVIPAGIIAPALALIFIEPDRGTTLLMVAVCAVMLFTSGASLKFCLPPVVLGLAGGALYFARDQLVMSRLKSWWFLEESKLDKGFQAYQAMLAFARGGVSGLGLGNGRQKLGFVPEHHTDMILSIVGEELGLGGTLVVLVLFAVLVGCGLVIASRARDHFGMLVATGITTLIGFQALINIGVVTSALPCKGLPLPFISYGGSNLVMMLGCVGLLFNIARQGQADELCSPSAFAATDLPAHQTT
jgi:cell division protein FtsW